MQAILQKLHVCNCFDQLVASECGDLARLVAPAIVTSLAVHGNLKRTSSDADTTGVAGVDIKLKEALTDLAMHILDSLNAHEVLIYRAC